MSEKTRPTQDELSKFVNSHVYRCCSSLIFELSNQPDYQEELFEIIAQDDYRSPLEDIDELDRAPICGKISSMTDNECRDFCIENHIEPYQNEALEHWIVSDWLADRLAEHGEMVNKDFYGLPIWGRTCSGQAIKLDGIIETIYTETYG